MSISLEAIESVWNTNPGGLGFAMYADALHRAGETAKAHSVLTEGLSKWPRHFSGRMLLGRISQELGDMESARAAFQEAVAQNSNSPMALRSLATILGTQQYQRQAIDHWVRLSLVDPLDSEASSMARSLIANLETTSSLADLGLGIRDVEDASSREALSEGASATGKGFSSLESDSPLAAWGSEAAVEPAFDLGDLAFPVPPSQGAAAGWTTEGMESTLPSNPAVPQGDLSTEISRPAMGPEIDSGLATLEMTSFPVHSIPPPPLQGPSGVEPDAPRPLAAGANESGTHVLDVLPALTSPEVVSAEPGPDVTQFVPRTEMSGQVTGEDIGNRLDAMFSDLEPEATAPTLPQAASVPPIQDMASSAGLSEISRPSSAGVPDRVSGEDVEDRLSELFGAPSEMPPPAAPLADLSLPPLAAPAPSPELPAPAALEIPSPSAPEKPAVAGNAPVTGNDIEARLDDLFGASAFDLPISDPPSPPTQVGESVSSGIEQRLDTLFSEGTELRQDTLKASDTSAMDRDDIFGDSSSSEATLENMRAFETAAAPISAVRESASDETAAAFRDPSSSEETAAGRPTLADPSDVDSGGSTIDIPTQGIVSSAPGTTAPVRLTGQDLDSQLDDLFASSEFTMDDSQVPTARKTTPSPAGPITGDDIGDRLDDLFGSDSDFPAGVPTVTLAEEYLRQGYREQALAVFRQLAGRDPSNAEIQRRIAEIEGSGT
ncbi:MAG: tetratricopeptide repeat protein [Fibrobacteria bacterium]|nr:tetratricopeptide repeat protein [Fibrobacteria bacterium]